MSEHARSEVRGVVIPFPVRSTASSEADRLERALAGLLRATREQAAAVAAWRTSLAALDRSVTGLAGSVGRYQWALSQTAERVDELREQALKLEASLPD